jgi:oligopeptidase B
MRGPGDEMNEAMALEKSVRPPVARRDSKQTTLHGDVRVDDYFWLREKESPEVISHLEAENRYADEVMRDTEELQGALYREMVSRIQESDVSAPYAIGEWLYYHRTEKGKQYPIYCRKKSPDAPEQVLLDLNTLSAGKEFIALGSFEVSDDGNLLAYTTDTTGFREYTLFVKDLASGNLLPDRAEHVDSAAWAADGRTLFYTIEDDAKRSYRLYRHTLGSGGDDLLFEESDERFGLAVGRSRSRRFLFLCASSHTASEWRYLPADRPQGDWRMISARRSEHEYEIDHSGERFFIRTNDRGRNFRLVEAPISDPSENNWEEVLAHDSAVMREEIHLFARHAVLLERENGLPQLRIVDLASKLSHRVAFSEEAYSVFSSHNEVFDTALFRYRYESLVTPASTFDYDTEKRVSRLVKRKEVLGGYDASAYRTERLFVPAKDGVKVPVALVYRIDSRRGEPSPLWLYGYGAYGLSRPTDFDSNRLSLLDRGFILAFAQVRGGSELGKEWHDSGRMLKKKNTFSDFISVAEHLISRGDTSPDRLVIEGRSAGGLLIGAVVNMRPELFRAAVLGVPFLDVVNTMLDASLPLTVGEYEEWGNPNVRAEYEYIKTYSPYDNLEAKIYPAMLVKTSFNDSQVMYWEPAKYVAKLRALKTDSNALLLKTIMAAGHGGRSGRYDHLREIAFDYAFILKQAGIDR